MIRISPASEAGQLEAALAACGPALRLAMPIAPWTAQRRGDIPHVAWAAYGGELPRVRQSKASRQLLTPVAAPRDGLYIGSHDGRPYTSDGFRSTWAKAAARAGADLTVHDIRGAFATRAYDCGAADAEVAAITVHGAGGQQHATLRRHYLQLNLALARECIRKLETRTSLADALANDRRDRN